LYVVFFSYLQNIGDIVIVGWVKNGYFVGQITKAEKDSGAAIFWSKVFEKETYKKNKKERGVFWLGTAAPC